MEAQREEEVVGAPIHPEWTQVVQFPQDSEQTPRVMCFIHFRLSRLRFALRRDIADYRDIQLLSFFNRGRCQFFFIFIFLFIDLLYGGQSQSMADYLQQVAYSFRGLRGQKPPS